jgi:hypothetical protein
MNAKGWTTEAGLPGLVIQVPSLGLLCGYVGVPPGHPWHGKGYDDIGADVHGGLTYAQPHRPREDADPGGRWWVGFDCAHVGDYVPGLGRLSPGDVEWDEPAVRAEVERLAKQAREAAP